MLLNLGERRLSVARRRRKRKESESSAGRRRRDSRETSVGYFHITNHSRYHIRPYIRHLQKNVYRKISNIFIYVSYNACFFPRSDLSFLQGCSARPGVRPTMRAGALRGRRTAPSSACRAAIRCPDSSAPRFSICGVRKENTDEETRR